jgi:hypothetical protein
MFRWLTNRAVILILAPIVAIMALPARILGGVKTVRADGVNGANDGRGGFTPLNCGETSSGS